MPPADRSVVNLGEGGSCMLVECFFNYCFTEAMLLKKVTLSVLALDSYGYGLHPIDCFRL